MRVVADADGARRASSPKRSAKPARRSAGPTCSSSATSRAPSTSKCRSSATRTATSCTSGSATARCSGGTRRSSKSRRASTCRRSCASAICDAAVRAVPVGRLSQRRHGRVPARRRPRRVLLHRGEPAHPGRAHGHRDGHRHRPRPQPDPRRAGPQAARAAGQHSRAGRRSNAAASRCSAASRPKIPDRHFIPDYGRITTYRSAGGFAVRLDGGNGFGGAVITPYFDSLLVKVTTWGSTLEEAAQRARSRAARVPHPRRQDQHRVPAEPDRPPDVQVGRGDDDVHRRHAGAVPVPRAARPRDEDALLPRRRHRQRPAGREGHGRSGSASCRRRVPPPCRTAEHAAAGHAAEAAGARARRSSPSGSASEKRLLLTDTTLRDAHQSLLATRVRTYDMLAVADAIARLTPNLFSLEMWGGATFDTSMRFLQEDPWERLDRAARRGSRTSCSRCCCAPATPSATRPIPTTSSARSSSAAPRPASTSSASSTR